MNQAIVRALVKKYIDGTATPDEEQKLLEWYRSTSNHEAEWVSGSWDEEEIVKERILAEIVNKRVPVLKRHKIHYTVAASILVLFSAALVFWLKRPQHTYITNSTAAIHPGSNKAVLILADGSKVSLDDTKQGLLARQGSVIIKRAKNGQIVYDLSAAKGAAGQMVGYNTIVTPRGGQYQIVLPDGSNVWLNAASSLKFPTAFKGRERGVQLTGEAYFEVAKNKAMPFKVNVNQSQVEVLGTHFDVMGYPEENATNTTLLEGSVKIINGNSVKIIKPGEQAKVADEDIKVDEVDAEQSIAWKNGYFVFNDENIRTLMNQISRWYDVDVEYGPGIANEKFGGIISKYKNIDQILRKMELTNTIHFKIEGRRITVMK